MSTSKAPHSSPYTPNISHEKPMRIVVEIRIKLKTARLAEKDPSSIEILRLLSFTQVGNETQIKQRIKNNLYVQSASKVVRGRKLL